MQITLATHFRHVKENPSTSVTQQRWSIWRFPSSCYLSIKTVLYFFTAFFIANKSSWASLKWSIHIKEQWSLINTWKWLGIALRHVVNKKHQLHYTHIGSKLQFAASENLGRKLFSASVFSILVATGPPHPAFHLFRVQLLLSSFSNVSVETLIIHLHIPGQI